LKNTTPRDRHGFTIIELLIVIAIIGTLMGVLLPAVQKARESAARLKCQNNLRQIGLALHNYETEMGRFPAGGVGVDASSNIIIDSLSTYTRILPFMEAGDVYVLFDQRFPYNDNVNAPGNPAAAKYAIPSYLCPSNPFRGSNGRDSFGYGYCDYLQIAFTDINPNPVVGTPIRLPAGSPLDTGGLGPGGTKPETITDGLSNTLGIIEDVGRGDTYYSSQYVDPVGFEVINGYRATWRWAEPAGGDGISGPLGAKFGDPRLYMIDNNPIPVGGPPSCPWSFTNCGVNAEPFSFHGQGCNAVFMDGHVTWLKNTIDPIMLRRLVTAHENLPLLSPDY
jgi:prepilin-type N-terminal cleavage/methylation domain-containing protein/prepilin-type processing-associated H-X9-DG protein